MLKSGIYEIQNVITGKAYIGSSVNIDKRWKSHLYALRRGTHGNKYLQRAFNKYGEDVFQFIILERILFSENLIFLEQKYLDKLKPEYNIVLMAGSQLGLKHTEKAKEKLRKANLGKHPSEVARKKMSEVHKGEKNPNFGKPMSEEQKKKISETKKGKPYSFKGKPHPHKGVPRSKETRKKISEAKKGKHYPKLSEAKKKYWENKKLIEDKK